MAETIVSAMLKRTSLFGDLSLPERLMLARGLKRRDVPVNGVIFRTGEAGRSFFVVVAGRVAICLARAGRRLVLAELGPGSYFGELSVIDGRPRSADAIALVGTELFELGQEEFFQLLDVNPSIAKKLLVEVCRRLRDADAQIGSLATIDAAGRIVRALRQLGERDGRREGDRVLFARAPSQKDIAALAGTTRATTSRIVRRLTQQGLLRPSGSGVILLERQMRPDDNL
ncbi:MAG TPA: Crp/Fnr family transcriptional regulator [Solirubrobacterales bacterium]|nr:Crp/Fnr family transcriptional regulator [Solirubrobacterales bacterium]